MNPVGRKRIAAILAIDMKGYSAQAEYDAAAAASAVRALHARVHAVAQSRSGRVFSSAGDGLMCEFAAASEAVAAAADMLAANPPDAAPVRIGVHLGEAFEHEGDDLLGHGVNVAARLEQLAQPGAALISRTAAEMVQGDLARRLVPMGRVSLDKMNETIEVFVLDPAAPSGRPRPPRRKRTQLAIAGIAGAAALFAMIAILVSTGVFGRRDTSVSDPAVLEQVTREVASRLAAEAQSTPGDASFHALASLAASREPNAQAAFAFLRAGETEQAVTTLERFGGELAERGVSAEAANAYVRAAQVAAFFDPRRALANAQRAVDEDPNSKLALEQLLMLTRSVEGHAAAMQTARAVVAREREPSPTRAFAYAMVVQLSGDFTWGAEAERALEAVNREAPLFPGDEYLQASAMLARGEGALRQLNISAASRFFEDAYARFQRIPGSEWRGHVGVMNAAHASGDLERVWALGRASIEERERRGWPPDTQALRSTCIHGMLMIGAIEQARPVCQALARAQNHPLAAQQATLILSLAERRVDDARRQAAALRAQMGSLPPEGRAFAREIIDYTEFYLALLENDLARADRLIAAKRAGLARTPGRQTEEVQVLIMAARIDHAMGRTARACPRWAEAAQIYRSFGAEPGALFAERQAREAHCSG